MPNWYLEYVDIAVGSDTASRITATNTYEKSNLNRVPFGVQESPLITLEHNNWVLDGSFVSLADQEIGYWSTNLSDENSSYQSPQVITIKLDDKFSSMGVQLRFKPETEEWASNLSIVWYQDDTELASENFVPDNSIYFCSTTVEAFNKVVITVNKTSKPFRRLRIDHILFGVNRLFYPNQLISADIQQNLSPISDILPESSLSFELDDIDDIEFMFQQKQPVNVWYEKQILAAFYIKGSKRSSLSRYSLECENAIGILTDLPFSPVMYEVETDAKAVIKGLIGDQFVLDWDGSLVNKTIRGYLNVKTKREALQQICFAIGAVISTTKTQGIKVFKIGTQEAKIIEQGRIYEGNNVDKAAILTNLNIYSHLYTPVTDQKAGDDVIKIGEGVDAKYYLHTFTIKTKENPNISKNAKANVMEIKEATLVNSDNVAEIEERVYDYLMKVSTHNFKFVLETEELGDYVTAATPYEEEKSGILEYMRLTFSGIVGVEGKYKF
jgi:hypothetical protein